MIQVLTISLWAHLFCGKWSEPESVFGWLKKWLYRQNACTGRYIIPEWVSKPLIGCAMCHAVWVSLIAESAWIYRYGFCAENALSVLCSSFGAILLDDFQTWRENKINR